ncbi:MAG: Do family serine endopeptidase [Rickettsiales bacterium]|nr:Do family serine endopeptidase [Pseudomonadota bacterium]MDA0966229.1 Do family serine endopeptidase [Pseudomonadota bacterium]MDG4543106.1 Do family serine endopeptidase [Rickettsiales bacterium]MDG4545304.1 Do family serine endopeptidase [Rickettsiales bacterium]MDG4547753.1 Do family serine endopeptidase [Rickettsiales bacterium]
MRISFALLSVIISLLLILSWHGNAHAAEKKAPSSKEEVILSYAPLVKTASPAVVNIYTKKKVTVKRGISPFFNDPIFQHFFGNNFSGGSVTERIESSLGSGVIVSKGGLIITNHHVISDSTDIRVVLSDRREFNAKVLLKDERTDLALLKIDTDKDLPYLELMDSDDLEVGDIVVAIGNPFGVGQTVTSGIVSAVARTTIGISDYQFFIQTDAAINPGNSGGALINMEGKLAGLNTAIFSKTGASNGIGFAIPSNMVKTVIRTKGERVVRPWLGIGIQAVTQEIANSIGLERPVGGILSAVHPDSPASRAGLKVGDVIVGIDEHEILDEHALHFRVATYNIGATASIHFVRNGNLKSSRIEMEQPPEKPKRDTRIFKGNNPLSGTTVMNLSPAVADELGLKFLAEGVIITNIDKGVASRIGINKNDIIKTVNNKEISTTKQLEELLNSNFATWSITVQRGNRLLNIIWNVR